MTGTRRVPRFVADRRGQITLVFALTLLVVLTAIGSAFDLGRAYLARQGLASAATLTCQFASRPSVVAAAFAMSGGSAAYRTQVTSYLTGVLTSQNLPWTQTNATPFTFTVNGPADVNVAASVPTTLMNLIGVSSVPVSASAHCYDVPGGSGPPPVATAQQPVLINEGFEVAPCSGTCWAAVNPNGALTVGNPNPVFMPPNTPSYSGSTFNEWVVTGYCLEVDSATIILSTVPEGTHSAELDCDNASGNAGNSSISTKVYLQAQQYEIRWFYSGRIPNYDYTPTYICGSTASDTAWANDTRYAANLGVRTNQINVYLDLSDGHSAPPSHTTIDGLEQLAGSSLVDTCVHSTTWIERSIIVNVSTAGYYWVSFAADGANDSYGGQIDDIRMCVTTCAGSPQDNFPPSWSAANHGGSNVTLFEDTFESPLYLPTLNAENSLGNLNLSLGTSGGSSGWPQQNTSGWATAPTNSVAYMAGPGLSAQGNQSVQLDNFGLTPGNKLASRPFLLDPGYYQLSYYYVSNTLFASLSGVSCGATPTAANLSSLSGTSTGVYRSGLPAGNVARNTNIVGVFMSHAQLASTPNGGGLIGTATTYSNPDGTTSITPTVPPNGISLTGYNSSQVNPLLDICGYASGWQLRTANIRIIKPAYYWLTLASLGSSDGLGGGIDDVKLTALGGPYMSNAPSGAVTIPVPDPQPGAAVNMTGYSIVAEPQYR